MFFPYATDAPIYHWPITTVLMIVLNVFVFCALMANPDYAEWLVLEHGNGLQPAQWVTSNFVHAGIFHLLGNMVSLWSFGLIVEGKLGWYKTLAVFLGIGAVQCAVEQVLLLDGPPGVSFGASAIVFGYMAISLIWAPENEMQCIVIYGFRAGDFEIRVISLVGILLAVEIAIAVFVDAGAGSSVLHLMGAALGFAVAIVMLKARLIDCENWDAFSVWAGRHKMTPEEREREEVESPEYQRLLAEKLQKRRDGALEEIRQVIRSGQPQLALQAHQRMSREIPDWSLSEADLLGIIKAFDAKKLWKESVPALVEYLSHYSGKAALVRLKLAQILLSEEKRPAQALKVMAKIDEAALDDAQRDFLRRLRAKAQKSHAQDPYEVVEEDW